MPPEVDIDPVQAFRGLTPDEMLNAVEQTYLHNRKEFADGRFLALNSYENRVYQIGVEGSENIVVKFYRPDRWNDDAILEEHAFTLELASREIPVIPPNSDANGQTLFSYGPFRFAVYPCRGGRELELDNEQHLQQMGRFVARIHGIGSHSDYQNRPTVDLDSYMKLPRRYLLDNQFIPVHIEEAYSTLTDRLIDQAEACMRRAVDVDTIRLHGDFHAGNVLWTDEGPHIVDFDDARMGPAIQDLWMFLSGDRGYMEARLKDLMKGYLQFRDFDFRELNLVESLRTMRMIYHAGWLASRWEDPAFPLAFPWFNTLEYWENHILNLREQSALMDEEPIRFNL